MHKKYWTTIFLVGAIPLYIYFIFYAPRSLEATLQYSGILWCLLFGFLLSKRQMDHQLVILALIGTAVADTFLLWPNGQEVVGVAVFIIVQGLYAWRLLLVSDSKQKKRSLWLRVSLSLLLPFMGILVAKDAYDLLAFATLFYLAQLVSNVIVSGIHIRWNTLFAIGLFLFLSCDLLVGLNSLQPYLSFDLYTFWLTRILLESPLNLMWLFYYPAQVFIVLSMK